jgi:hypothetical protein
MPENFFTRLKPVLKVFTMCCALAFTFKAKGQRVQSNHLTFIQGDSSYVITDNIDTIQLARKPFSLRYFGRRYDEKNEQFYAAQIAVLGHQDNTPQLKVGQRAGQLAYFEPGTGIAPGVNERYDTLYITNTGHHYLTYENEHAKRVDLVSTSEESLELEWRIEAAFYEDKDVQFTELALASLCFIVFIDKNLDDIIDLGELKTVIVQFR